MQCFLICRLSSAPSSPGRWSELRPSAHLTNEEARVCRDCMAHPGRTVDPWSQISKAGLQLHINAPSTIRNCWENSSFWLQIQEGWFLTLAQDMGVGQQACLASRNHLQGSCNRFLFQKHKELGPLFLYSSVKFIPIRNHCKSKPSPAPLKSPLVTSCEGLHEWLPSLSLFPHLLMNWEYEYLLLWDFPGSPVVKTPSFHCKSLIPD